MPSKVRPEPVIPDHEVLRKIGGGAYGEVWLARGVTGAMRAVKVVWRDDFDDDREFEREFQGILRYEPISRDHPALVHILHVGRGAGMEPFYYYVMELGDDVVTGREVNPVEYEPRNLRIDMKQAAGERLDTAFCLETGRRLAEGLRHLHGNGLAHRDVKPANVIFVDGRAKLADIGLVALRGQRTFVGTEGFVPPEGPGSAQADVYSLGKVLYEMATGKDRLEFPELPDELPEGDELKLWRGLNAAICDVCEPRISKRRILTAEMLSEELDRVARGARRPMRVSAGVVLGILVTAVVITGGWNFIPVRSMVITMDLDGDQAFVPARPTGLVKVTSSPLGAEVFTMDGESLKDTPLRPMRLPIGEEVQFVFRLNGYQTTRAGGMVTQDGLLIDAQLRVDAPPVQGELWTDVLEMSYHPEENYHVSNYYVGEEAWKEYQKETKRKAGVQFVSISESGEMRRVALASKAEAKRFMDWLTKKCRDGYLTEDHEMEARMDQSRDLLAAKVDPKLVKQGLRPFWSVVRHIPPARIEVTSEPPGASVWITIPVKGKEPVDRMLGYTPLTDEDGQPGLRVRPGSFELRVVMEGYREYRKELKLESHGKAGPLHVVLEENQGVVFGKPWDNSLEMHFEPLGADLMVSAWETRVRDYQEFLKLSGKRKPEVEAELVGMDPALPVVFVNREDAMEFCRWLTEIERERERIAQTHEYRLPTDLEWSQMAGLKGESGDWPQARDGQQLGGFPWGNIWPPPIAAGNFADGAAAGLEGIPENKTISGYYDGYENLAPVGMFDSNIHNLFDLAGNVHEWVSDDYNPSGTHGVTRGGGWKTYQEEHLRIAARNAVDPGIASRNNLYGFRVVLAKTPESLETIGSEAPDRLEVQP